MRQNHARCEIATRSASGFGRPGTLRPQEDKTTSDKQVDAFFHDCRHRIALLNTGSHRGPTDWQDFYAACASASYQANTIATRLPKSKQLSVSLKAHALISSLPSSVITSSEALESNSFSYDNVPRITNVSKSASKLLSAHTTRLGGNLFISAPCNEMTRFWSIYTSFSTGLSKT